MSFACLNTRFKNTNIHFQYVAFHGFAVGFHVRRLQVRFKMRDAFPLLGVIFAN